MSRQYWLIVALLCYVPTGLAQSDSLEDLIEEQRQLLQEEVSNSSIGAGYAQMLNFFIEPSISASRLDTEDADYDIFKLPMQYEISGADGAPDILLRATLSSAKAEETFSLIEGETIDGEWSADSGGFGAGLRWPVSERLSLLLGGEVGVSRLRSDADYNGPLGQILVAPVADGVLLNWDTNAWIAGVQTGLDYAWRWRERYELTAKGRYVYSHISSYSESRDLPGFSEDTGTASLKVDLKHPLPFTLWDSPMFGIANVAATAFTGNNRDALGFTHFYDLGYSIGIDLSAKNRYLQDISLGYQISSGKDVDGYSILVGWTFKRPKVSSRL